MAKHVDDYRADDMPYIRTNDDWAYGERAYWRTEDKLVALLSTFATAAQN